MKLHKVSSIVSAIKMALMVFMASCSKDDTMMQYLQVPDMIFLRNIIAVR